MRIEGLELERIRSYQRASVSFPSGTTLLSGDIGSGKTTILLAIEFALFGIQRGELSGGALLRHGALTGSVTLHLRLRDRSVTITRRLKRGPSGVTQESGSLTLDGVTTEYTAQELKSRILELLRYPASLLTKKGMLFRYTVYTPQEEMRRILELRADERLDTLRKLFAMDRYKRARENAALLVRELKRDEQQLVQRVAELGEQSASKEELVERKRLLAEAIARREAVIVEQRSLLAAKQQALTEVERRRFLHDEHKKKTAITSARIATGKERIAELDTRAATLERHIAETDLAPSDTDMDALAREAETLRAHQARIDEKRSAIRRREGEHDAAIKRSEETIASVDALTECPTCQQSVDEDHKRRIRADERRRIEAHRVKREELTALNAELDKRQAILEQRRSENEQKRRLVEANRLKQQQLDRYKAELRTIAETRTKLEAEQRERQRELATQAPPAVPDEELAVAKRSVDEVRARVQRDEVALAEQRKEREYLDKELDRVERIAKERMKAELEGRAVKRRISWLTRQFINVAHAVERHRFLSIYGMFNEYFREWFGMLVEDERIAVRLDHAFSPVIVQDGYETTVDFLSGGERTSVALAYRLALNRVINEFLDDINTRGLLILDEPTEGFSTEQLDRVREVLDRLTLEQVIVVSHEAKVEGFVDHIIRIEKRGHTSVVV